MRRDWSVDDFDAMELGRGKSTKFDGAEAPVSDYSYLTAGIGPPQQQLLILLILIEYY